MDLFAQLRARSISNIILFVGEDKGLWRDFYRWGDLYVGNAIPRSRAVEQ